MKQQQNVMIAFIIMLVICLIINSSEAREMKRYKLINDKLVEQNVISNVLNMDCRYEQCVYVTANGANYDATFIDNENWLVTDQMSMEVKDVNEKGNIIKIRSGGYNAMPSVVLETKENVYIANKTQQSWYSPKKLFIQNNAQQPEGQTITLGQEIRTLDLLNGTMDGIRTDFTSIKTSVTNVKKLELVLQTNSIATLMLKEGFLYLEGAQIAIPNVQDFWVSNSIIFVLQHVGEDGKQYLHVVGNRVIDVTEMMSKGFNILTISERSFDRFTVVLKNGEVYDIKYGVVSKSSLLQDKIIGALAWTKADDELVVLELEKNVDVDQCQFIKTTRSCNAFIDETFSCSDDENGQPICDCGKSVYFITSAEHLFTIAGDLYQHVGKTCTSLITKPTLSTNWSKMTFKYRETGLSDGKKTFDDVIVNKKDTFGKNPQLTLDNGVAIVEFGDEATIEKDNFFTIKSQVLQLSGNDLTLPLKNAFTTGVIAEQDIIQVGKCDDAIIDMTNSFNLPKRRNRYIYTVTGSSFTKDTELFSSTTSGVVPFTHEYLSEEKNYTITVRSKTLRDDSAYVLESNPKTIQFIRTAELRPKFDVVGGSKHVATFGSTLKLIAEPLITECSATVVSAFEYDWEIPASLGTTTKNDGKHVEVTLNTGEPIGSHLVTVTLKFGTNSIRKNITVTTEYPDASIIFPQGSYIRASSAKDLVVEVETNDPMDPSGAMNFIDWNCTHGSAPCGFSVSSGNNVKKQVIPSSSLVANSEYTFTATYKRSGKEYASTLKVNVVNAVVPVVNINRPGKNNIVASGQDLILQSVVSGVSSLDGLLTYNWEVTKNGQPLTLVLGQNIKTPSNLQTFALDASIITPGSVLDITCKVAGERASIIGEGANTISLIVNTPPTGGSFNVAPTVGDQLTTTFSFVASSWVDEHQPLEYAFSIREAGSNGDFTLFQRFSKKNSFSSFLALSNNLEVKCDIRDSLGSFTSVTSNVTVNAITSTQLSIRVQSIINLNLKKAIEIGDAEEIRRIVSQLSLVAKTVPSVRSVVFGALADAKTVLIEEESLSSLQQQSTIMKHLLDGELDDSTQSSAATFIETLVDSSSTVDTTSTQELTESLSRVLSSTSQKASSDSVRASVTTKVFSSMNKLVDKMATNQLNGAKPTIISSSNVQMGVFTADSKKMSSEPIELGNGASLSVPDNTVVADKPIDISFLVVKDDPHFELRSDSTAKNLSSSVTRLLFKIDGQEQSVHDRPAPLIFTIPANNDLAKIEANPNNPGVRPQCKYLNTLTNKWETTGCNTTSYTATTTTCACNHATDFASFMDYVTPDLNLLSAEDILLLKELNTDNFTTLIVLCTLVGLYALTLILFNVGHLSCFLASKVAKQPAQPKRYLHSEKQMKGYIRPLIEKVKKSHIWLSVFLKPETQSSFNRSRRLTIVMVIIFGSLLSNALTFGTKQQNWVQSILAGVFADIVCVPFVFLFTFAFVKVKPFGYRAVKVQKKKKKQTSFSAEEELKRVQEASQDVNDFNQVVVSPEVFDDSKSSTPSSEAIPVATRSTPMDRVFDKIDNSLKFIYDKFVTMTETVTWYGISVLFFSTLLYFAAVAGCMVIIYYTINWFSPELELFIFGTAAVFIYFAALELIYLSTKSRRFQETNMSWRGKTGWKIQLLICITLSILLLCGLFVSVFFMNALDQNGLPNEWMITIQVGFLGCIGLVSIWIFDMLRNPKKKEKTSNSEPGFFARPWFPWWSAYIIYLATWLWMAGSGLALVIYGIKFNKWGQGTDIKWLTSSLVANAQNVFINKPVSFVARTIVLMAIVRLIESLFFRVRRERKVEAA